MRSVKKELEERAAALRLRLEEEEVTRNHYRQLGRKALDEADSVLQSVELSLATPEGAALSARAGRSAPLPPIAPPRPESASGHDR